MPYKKYFVDSWLEQGLMVFKGAGVFVNFQIKD
jgi:hypothetical protein